MYAFIQTWLASYVFDCSPWTTLMEILDADAQQEERFKSGDLSTGTDAGSYH